MADPTDSMTATLGTLNLQADPNIYGLHAHDTPAQHLQNLESFRATACERNWAVGSKTWNTAWQASFGAPYTADQNPFVGEKHCGYFDRFPDFATNPRVSIRHQFNHLATKKGWVSGDGVCESELAELLAAAKEGKKKNKRKKKKAAVDAKPANPYFAQFPEFTPDTSKTLANQFAALAQQQGWRKGDTNWRAGRAALYHEEFALVFGSEGTLQEWQRFCAAVEVAVDTVPETIGQCKKALKRTFVNLVNLLEHLRNPEVIPLAKFGNYWQFQTYTLDGRIMPKKQAKENKFLEMLLKKVY